MSDAAQPMSGQVCLVTGATSGIGRVTVEALARQGATTILVARDPARGAAAVDRIRQATGNTQVEVLLADLSVQADVRRLAHEVQSRYPRLDVLVNNAGALFSRRTLSADGLEMTWALNHLAYYLLTTLLLDTLKASAPARIVNVSSGAHRHAHLDFDDLQGQQRYGGWRAYAQSKLANVLFTYELARRLDGTGVTTNALHPGFVATNFGRRNRRLTTVLFRAVQRVAALSPEQGAETLIYLATSPEVEGVTGQYFVKRQAVRSSDASYDVPAAQRLWQVSVELARP
jgi:NAD(P)-dependent dehydrogenase (short-subunit alcohol dehydrogenase family)